MIPRRRLKVDAGDIVIVRLPGGFHTLARSVYYVHVHGQTGRPDRFAAFDHAAGEAEQLASTRKVRLFYVDGAGEPPHLLNDFRGAHD